MNASFVYDEKGFIKNKGGDPTRLRTVSVRHMLSGCKVLLHQGWYLYCHNQVFWVLAHHIQSFLNANKVRSLGIKNIHFVKEGSKEKKGRKPNLGILHRAKDFKLNADLNDLLKFPNYIAECVSQRPDIVIYRKNPW